MLRIVRRVGRCPDRWKKVYNILLLKKPGDFRVHRLRCIHIREADQNYQVKYDIAKQFTRHAEKHQVIPEASHGSRKGRQAVDAAWASGLPLP